MDRIHIFINGDRGFAVLEGLLRDGHAVACVHVPATLDPKGDVVSRIAKLGLAAEPVADVNDPDFVRSYAARKPRLGIIAGYSTIFRAPVYEAPELGTINCHAGRVPDYRGGSPLNWQILNGERAAGISVLRVDAGIDSGDVLAAADLAIEPDDTIATLHGRANAAFPELVVDVVRRFSQGDLAGQAQDPAMAVYWHQRSDADGRIVWDRWTARQVCDAVRALSAPYPGAWTKLSDQTLRILAASLDCPHVRGVAGRVVHVSGSGPLVVCADRAIKLVAWRLGDGSVPRLRTGERLA